MRITRPEQIKIGKRYYYTHALGKNSFVYSFIITSTPYNSHNIGLFVDTKNRVRSYLFNRRSYTVKSSISLQDANVVPNTYNLHRLFNVRKEATAYKQKAIKGDLDLLYRSTFGY
jgi:hypothetical protein